MWNTSRYLLHPRGLWKHKESAEKHFENQFSKTVGAGVRVTTQEEAMPRLQRGAEKVPFAALQPCSLAAWLGGLALGGPLHPTRPVSVEKGPHATEGLAPSQGVHDPLSPLPCPSSRPSPLSCQHHPSCVSQGSLLHLGRSRPHWWGTGGTLSIGGGGRTGVSETEEGARGAPRYWLPFAEPWGPMAGGHCR